MLIGQARGALRVGWESHSSVRFVGWQDCGELSASQRDKTVDFLIKVGGANNSAVGYADAQIGLTQIIPWGHDGPTCIEYNALQARYEYSFDCVREYAIHEFGHVLAFGHEWQHPNTPEACSQSAAEPKLSHAEVSNDWSATNKSVPYYAPNLAFDWDSVMTYNDKCADVTGRRFGSQVPDDWDRKALQHAYPPVTRDEDAVGVIPDKASDCPQGSLVTIYMDNENENNENTRGGWTGAVRSTSNTRLEVCQVDGSRLGRLAGSGSGPPGLADYAVLRLGESCPTGASEVIRYHDDEDDHNGAANGETAVETEEGLNTNWMAGDVGPTRQNFGGTGTELHWCVFLEAPAGEAKMSDFPGFGFVYGVLAPDDHPKAKETGYFRTDDEDDDNKNDVNPLGDASDSLIFRLARVGSNTLYRLARVNGPPSGGTDETPPVIAVSRPPTTNGWYNSDVNIAWTCTDPSGVEDETGSVTVSAEGSDLSATAECVDLAGNRASHTVTGINIDKTKPTANPTHLPAANSDGWHRDDVAVTWNWSDKQGGSGLDASNCTSASKSAAEGAEVVVTATCTDKAGNKGDASVTFKVDKTKPTANPTHLPAANSDGWHRDDVAVTWNWSDKQGGSGLDASNCTSASKSAAEGAEVVVTATCTDKAGNKGDASVTFKVDKTKPTIQIASPLDMATFDLEQVVGTSYDCSDESTGSGVASCVGDVANGDPADTANAGQHTFTVVARDNADNESSKTVTYTVLKAPTRLAAEPLLVGLDFSSLVVTVGRVSARLTYGPAAKPAAGRTVVFSAASERLCTATTRPDGTATCTFGLTSTLRAALSLGYSVTFDGDHNLLPSKAKGSAAAIFGWGVAG